MWEGNNPALGWGDVGWCWWVLVGAGLHDVYVGSFGSWFVQWAPLPNVDVYQVSPLGSLLVGLCSLTVLGDDTRLCDAPFPT